MPKMATFMYLCGHEYRSEIQADTSKAQLCIMQMQCAGVDCPECASPKADPDWMDVHKRGNYDRTKA